MLVPAPCRGLPTGAPAHCCALPAHCLRGKHLDAHAYVCACLVQAYPHHGGIRLLEPQHTDAGRPTIDRFVAEDYIIDTLASFDNDR